MSNLRKLLTCGVCLLAAPGYMAKAGPSDAALLNQVKQIASQGQDAQTAAQVNQYVDKNQDIITAILKGYVNYLKQIQSMAADDGTGTPATVRANRQSNTGDAQTASVEGTAGGRETSAPMQSAELQASGVQASSGLQTAHLAGYPALPAVEPVSSITHPTVGQLENAAKVQREMQERKAYLMEHPQGYTY